MTHTVVMRHPLCAGKGCLSCARIDADHARVRAELRVRLDRFGVDHEAALRWLADEHPDLVNEALTETGAHA